MKILYISSAVEEKEFKEMEKEKKLDKEYTSYGMQEAGNKFHRLLIEGISNRNTIYSIVGRPISKIYKKLIWKNKKVVINENLIYEYIMLINIPIIKQILVSIQMLFKILYWLIKNRKDKDKVIIFDAAYVSVIPSIIFPTKIIKCKKVSIVADIYSYMADTDTNNGRKKLIISNILKKIMKHCYKSIDAYILLTEEMSNLINKENKPYIVIEGFSDIKMKEIQNKFENKNVKNVIMYAGALRKEYGLDILVNGFCKYQDENAELWIYGDGTYVKEIINATNKDNRIKFKGVVSNDKIIEKEIEATLLVNPRPTKDEFTKYSFPSKNMEYMASGTLVLTTKLAGMPKEYYPYVEVIEKETEDGIQGKIKDIFNKNKEELYKKGVEGKEFIIRNKNNMVQGKKIMDFINKIVKE